MNIALICRCGCGDFDKVENKGFFGAYIDRFKCKSCGVVLRIFYK